MPSTLYPQDWFHNDFSHTDENMAKPLIDGAIYFRELKSTIEGLGNAPYLLISAWRLNPETTIDMEDKQSVEELIERETLQKGLTTRSMSWFVPGSIAGFGAGHGPENHAFTELVLELGGEAILDNRLPPFGSHHQKFIVAGSDDEHVAFLGGIDIAPDRWDERSHNLTEDEREPEFFNAWHDVQVKIAGPAVAEIWNCFQERWNDPRSPHEFPGVGGAVPQSLDDNERPTVAKTGGTASIQVLKTYACKSNAGDGTLSPYPFANGGLYSYEKCLVKAIANAEHFVYLEDQYFWPCTVVDALQSAVENGVTVILVLAQNYDVPGLEPYHNFLRNDAIEQLRNAGEERVFVYHLEQAQLEPPITDRGEIYVHSKTMVIDDRYMVIGSANINRRSMTTDTELGVAIVDTHPVNSTINGGPETVSDAVRKYRKELWSEHLRAQVEDDPFDANGRPAGFPTGDELVGHLRQHEVSEPRFCRPSIIPFGMMNTRITCS